MRSLIARRLWAVAAIYVTLALIPPAPFDQPLFLLALLTAPAPTSVAGVRVKDLRDSWGNADEPDRPRPVMNA